MFIEARDFLSMSEDRLWNDIRLVKKLSWTGQQSEAVQIPQVEYGGHPGRNLLQSVRTEDWMRFLGWYITEGSSLKSNGEYKISLGIQDPETEEYRSVLERIGIAYRKVRFTNVPGTIFNSKQLYSYLAPLGHAHDKRIPAEVKKLSRYHLSILLETLLKGDGYIHPSGTAMYGTSSKILAEDVSELAIKCGHWPTIHRDEKRGMYNVSVKKAYRGTMLHRPKAVPYSGKVWCVTVPNGTVIVERHGRISVSGNSYMLMFREIWGMLPSKVRRVTYNLTKQGILTAPGLKYASAEEFVKL